MSLIPDKPLLFYPQLAVALGLEGAIMIQTLKEFIDQGDSEIHNGFLWIDMTGEKLSGLLPFWTEADIQRITQQLHEQGILLIGSATFRQDQVFRIAINERHETVPAQAQVAISTRQDNTEQGSTRQDSTHQDSMRQDQETRVHTDRLRDRHHTPSNPDQYQGASPIPARWQPDRDLLAQLAQYSIPQAFALDQVGEFVTYWTERNEPKHSWAARYLKHVLRLWREQQTQEFKLSQEIAMTSSWRPSPEAMDSHHPGRY
jgi:DnaT-like ssDNA binding protein